MSLHKSKPHSDAARWIVVYPCYLNSKKKAVEGRKIARAAAIENPTCQEIYDVVQSSGLPCMAERKMHPRDAERDNLMLQGRVRVQIKKDDGAPLNAEIPNRMALLRHIATLIPKLKSRQPGAAGASAAAAPSAGGGKKANKKKK